MQTPLRKPRRVFLNSANCPVPEVEPETELIAMNCQLFFFTHYSPPDLSFLTPNCFPLLLVVDSVEQQCRIPPTKVDGS